MRVVSLLPSATEIVCAVGAGDRLVGISHECDHPAEIAGRPALTSPRLKMPDSSLAIDGRVREALLDAVAIYQVDAERLQALRPDLILTQDLCQVCAVSLSDVACALAPLDGPAPQILSLRPTQLEHVFEDILRVGEVLGEREEAASRVAAIRARLDAVAAAVADRSRPTVLTIEWTEPVMIGGTWMPQLVEIAGGRALLAQVGEASPVPTPEQLAGIDPDVVVIKPCGFTLERALAEIPVLQRTLPWERWSAVASGQVYICDGSALFNRSGPRLVDSAELLAAILHPDAVPELVHGLGHWARRVGPDGLHRL